MATSAPTTMIPSLMSGLSALKAKTKWWRCRWDGERLNHLLIAGHIALGGRLTVATVCACQGVRTPILQLSAMQEGDYTFQLTVTDSAGQQDTAQVTVIVQPGNYFWLLLALLSPVLTPGCLAGSFRLCVLSQYSSFTLRCTLYKYTCRISAPATILLLNILYSLTYLMCMCQFDLSEIAGAAV